MCLQTPFVCLSSETIGREEAETDYHQYVVPLIKKRPDLFSVPSGSTWEELYGLDVYHQMGSLILSRSFELEDDQEEERSENSSSSSGSTTQDDQGGSGGIAMLPMADMLNAKSGAENVESSFFKTTPHTYDFRRSQMDR